MLKQDEPVNVDVEPPRLRRRRSHADLHRQRAAVAGQTSTIHGDTIVARRQDRQPDGARPTSRTTMLLDETDPKTEAEKPSSTDDRRRPTLLVYDDAKRAGDLHRHDGDAGTRQGPHGDVTANSIELFLKPGRRTSSNAPKPTATSVVVDRSRRATASISPTRRPTRPT